MGVKEKKRVPAHDQIDRMKQIIGVRADSKLAPYLGVGQNTLTDWKSKKYQWVPPHIIIKFALRYGVSADWILFGVGDKYKDYSEVEYKDKPGFAFSSKVPIAKIEESSNETK